MNFTYSTMDGNFDNVDFSSIKASYNYNNSSPSLFAAPAANVSHFNNISAAADGHGPFYCPWSTSDYMRILADFNNMLRKYPGFVRTLVIVLYSMVSCFGAVGNVLVVVAVIRNPQMRIPRNFFIVNLALSDFMLCTFAVPLTAYLTLNAYWIFGAVTCKLTSLGSGVNIFVSTMSITCIGMDRYWAIIFPTKIYQQRMVIITCFVCMWVLSFALAFPQYYMTKLDVQTSKCNFELSVCLETWEMYPTMQKLYTLGCIMFQYLLPLAMLTFVYVRIMSRLRERMIFTRPSVYDDSRRIRSESRHRRTNMLLICIVMIFAISWLPFNIFNGLNAFEVIKYNVCLFAFCHIVGVMSACANPILYGLFNENFRNEFIAILTVLKVTTLCYSARNYLILRCCGRLALEEHLRRDAMMTRTRGRPSATQGSRCSSNGGLHINSEMAQALMNNVRTTSATALSSLLPTKTRAVSSSGRPSVPLSQSDVSSDWPSSVQHNGSGGGDGDDRKNGVVNNNNVKMNSATTPTKVAAAAAAKDRHHSVRLSPVTNNDFRMAAKRPTNEPCTTEEAAPLFGGGGDDANDRRRHSPRVKSLASPMGNGCTSAADRTAKMIDYNAAEDEQV